ncbi:hypothetical protein DN051_44575 (plasmid) [Streptomyces cadmiisoli]|uniref:Uncharacterized protein n=2 Tax=Streptomyces TaxID=1883 RepID=A0A2Z4JEZ9_9ACTN|nr:hypothetical protein DN051_44575 [Streptomyces cadmiisoli]
MQSLGMWEDFVEECEIGYASDLSEYLNDLSVRQLLQKVLDDAEAKRTETYLPFAQRVRRIYERFHEVVNEGPEVRPRSECWWDRRLPATGAAEFVADVWERYAVDLRTADS